MQRHDELNGDQERNQERRRSNHQGNVRRRNHQGNVETLTRNARQINSSLSAVVEFKNELNPSIVSIHFKNVNVLLS